MIGWKSSTGSDVAEGLGAPDAPEPMRLGDMMRGERATLGKSLLDVQRELKIKAAFISAIEDANPDAFDTPGFIAGYVRSYARYLDMDPDWAFECFCRESGFETAHGMSARASAPKTRAPIAANGDIFGHSATPFAPQDDPLFAGIEPRAVGSIAVLAALLLGLGYGAWSLLQEVQRVQFAPVDQAPVVASSLDPLAGGAIASGAGVARPSTEAFDRLYRPRALELPVMSARDAPIASLSAEPESPAAPVDAVEAAVLAALENNDGLPEMSPIQVTEGPAPAVALLAVRPVWVRVRAADGSVIFEKILEPGEEYVLPESEEAPSLRAGNSGSLFFKVAGQVYGPAGNGASTAKNVALSADALTESYALANPDDDSELAKFVTVAQVAPGQ